MVRQHTPEEILFRDELTRLGVTMLLVPAPPIDDMHTMCLKTTYNPTGNTVAAIVTWMAEDVARMVAEPRVFIQSFETAIESPESAWVKAAVHMRHH